VRKHGEHVIAQYDTRRISLGCATDSRWGAFTLHKVTCTLWPGHDGSHEAA
jgi:hypothetical protein